MSNQGQPMDQFLTHYHCRVCGAPHPNEYGYCDDCESVDQFEPDDWLLEDGLSLDGYDGDCSLELGMRSETNAID